MKLLFSMRHAGALRNFESTVGELASRGHEIHLAFMTRDKRGDDRVLQEITRRYSSVTSEEVRVKTPHAWADLVGDARAAADYLRYLAPEYRDARALRARAESRLLVGHEAHEGSATKTRRHEESATKTRRHEGVLASCLRPFVANPRFLRGSLMRTRPAQSTLALLLAGIERWTPPDPAIVSFVRRCNPDAVLVTPLLELGSEQAEYVKAARDLGVPTGFLVHSWDNLTNKGLIHVRPDRVFVWNDAQKREAVRLHGMAAEQVVVTGAPVFDQWFERGPSTTREAFCRTVGLPADKPFVLYLCSSQFIAPHEDGFVRKWIGALRAAADPGVRDAGILVRLHPRTHPKHAARFTFPEFDRVAVWPRGGANPVDTASKNDYFDSLYHAAAAVGVNTSAQIEAGIVGRPVFSIRVPEYTDTQEGTLHFHYLLNESGGLLRIADTFDEHTRGLAATLQAPEAHAERLQSFVEAFVRPHGLNVPATPLLADGIEALGRLPKAAPARHMMRGAAKRARALRPVAVRHLFR